MPTSRKDYNAAAKQLEGEFDELALAREIAFALLQKKKLLTSAQKRMLDETFALLQSGRQYFA